jgi:hypothetical protein
MQRNYEFLTKILLSSSVVIFLSCSDTNKSGPKDEERLVKPSISRREFDTLKNSDLAWRLIEPIFKSPIDEEQLMTKLSKGQKALYVFCDLDAEVSNGGFIQYYWNGYGKFISDVESSLKLIGDTTILKIVRQAELAYRKNKGQFDTQKTKDDWEPLYNKLKLFDTLDNLYYKCNQEGFLLLDKYIRQYPEEFVEIIN